MQTHPAVLSSPQTIGLIGVGLLGTALAERLLAAGFDLLGFDLDPQRTSQLQSLGGQAAAAVEEVARRCRRIVFSLPNSEAVDMVVRQIEIAGPPGSVLVDTTTGDPDQTAALGARVKALGRSYVDATVAGSSQQARDGTAVLMVGGEAESVRQCQDLFAAWTGKVFYLGPWGSGARMKLVVNLVLGLNRAVLAEGLHLARQAGLDLAKTLDVLHAGPAYSQVMDAKGERMLADDFFPPQARLAQHLKDVRLILEMAERVTAATPLSELHRSLLERAVERGFGEADNAAIIKAYGDSPKS